MHETNTLFSPIYRPEVGKLQPVHTWPTCESLPSPSLCFSNFNMPRNHLGIFLKCTFSVSRSRLGPKMPHFYQAPRCGHCSSRDHTLGNKFLGDVMERPHLWMCEPQTAARLSGTKILSQGCHQCYQIVHFLEHTRAREENRRGHTVWHCSASPPAVSPDTHTPIHVHTQHFWGLLGHLCGAADSTLPWEAQDLSSSLASVTFTLWSWSNHSRLSPSS